MALYKFCIIIN